MTIPETFPYPPAEWGETRLRRIAFMHLNPLSAATPKSVTATVSPAHGGCLEWGLRFTLPDGRARFMVVRENLHGRELPL